jgi:hypothetical protein
MAVEMVARAEILRVLLLLLQVLAPEDTQEPVAGSLRQDRVAAEQAEIMIREVVNMPVEAVAGLVY